MTLIYHFRSGLGDQVPTHPCFCLSLEHHGSQHELVGHLLLLSRTDESDQISQGIGETHNIQQSLQ